MYLRKRLLVCGDREAGCENTPLDSNEVPGIYQAYYIIPIDTYCYCCSTYSLRTAGRRPVGTNDRYWGPSLGKRRTSDTCSHVKLLKVVMFVLAHENTQRA